MHRRWFVLMLVLMVSCGRPLQVSTTPQPETQALPRPAVTTTLLETANSVPSETLSASAPITPALSNTQSVPTNEPATVIPVPAAGPPTASASVPSPTSAVAVVPRTVVAETNEQRWRAKQLNREVIQPPQLYVAASPVPLLWYDPLTGQSLQIGTIIGEFPVQAHFTLRSDNKPALEVPYRINIDFGLTSISDAVRDRMKAAGYTQSVEAYVIQNDAVQPK